MLSVAVGEACRALRIATASLKSSLISVSLDTRDTHPKGTRPLKKWVIVDLFSRAI